MSNKLRPQTIQIYLPKGNPRSLRVAEITTRIVRVIEIPRNQLNTFFDMPEAQQVGVYFLVGNLDDESSPQLYIGQTGDLINRLKEHNKSKDFWTRAFVTVSLTNSITQTHALFLEWLSIETATKVGRYTLQNKNTGSLPYTPDPLKADCHEIHETTATLLATLGQPIFETFTDNNTDIETALQSEQHEFYIKGRRDTQVHAKGQYTAEGFVVIKGSSASQAVRKSLEGTSAQQSIERLIKEGILSLTEDGQGYIFTRDHLFNSPSMAAMAVLGRSANGWNEWKTERGITLDALVRQSTTP